MSPTTLDQLLQYTTVAASTAREIANITNVPFLQVTAALTVSILSSVQVPFTTNEFTICLLNTLPDRSF
jgi:hypothetical protein